MNLTRDTKQRSGRRAASPLLYPAIVLSLASLAWTTWSLVDLLGTGLIGLTVAAGADIIWASVIIAEARGLHIPVGKSKRNIVPVVGWVALLVVAAFLAAHGVDKASLAMACAGPFLPLGAKSVWVLALADMRDPAALTPDELNTLARMERGMVFEEAQHHIEMRRREMNADIVLSEVDTDFRIELRRQDKTRELSRRRPLELEAVRSEPANALVRSTDASNRDRDDEGANSEDGQLVRVGSDTALVDTANSDANTAGQTVNSPVAFGFSAALPEANRRPRRTGGRSPRNANTTSRANTPREAAEAAFRESVAKGEPLTGAELGRLFGRTPRWGQKLIADLKGS
jgi:hypothetical protein